MAGFLVPFATGALGKVMDIREEQDQISGAMIDAASGHYLTNLNDEKLKLKNVDKVYKNIEDAYGTNVAEAMAHWGYLDSGDLKEAYSWIEKIGPTNINKLKTANIQDLQPVFENNFASTNKTIESKENVLAKNLNRGDLKNLSDLYFGKSIKKGKLDSTRQFLFGGPTLGEEDVVPSMLQLEKEIGKEKATLEEPDKQLLDVMSTLPLGPIVDASGTGFSASEFRLRQTDAADVALSSLGLGGKYTVENGEIKPISFTDLDGLQYAYASELISKAFLTEGFDLNTYKQAGTITANIIRNDLNLVNKSFINFKNAAAPNVELLPEIVKEGKKVFNQSGYELFLQSNVELLAKFASNKSYTARQLIIKRFGDGTYAKYFQKYLQELDQPPPR
tara:strand:- start:195 stop:1367 length:1173 start_codon:yes stop_codon:yes gene_type:complete